MGSTVEITEEELVADINCLAMGITEPILIISNWLAQAAEKQFGSGWQKRLFPHIKIVTL